MSNPPEGRRFRKGQSGNPNGRPKDPLAEELRKRWAKRGRISQLADALEAAIDAGDTLKGDKVALQILLDRTEGKVPQPVEQKFDGALRIEVVRVKSADHPAP